MPTDRILRVAVVGAVLGVLLAGCSSDSADRPGAATRAESGASTSDELSSQPSGASESPTSAGAAAPSSAPTSDSSTGAARPSPSTAGAEMPVAPAPSPTSLSQLLEPQHDSPLVTTPLPPAVSARGRLVAEFPVVLRPTRATRVESSSVSPAGDRLQVALVGSTSLSPAATLRAYRVRLSARGLAEQTAPPTIGGSQAAAFGRGPNHVTITVTRSGDRTNYTVHAVLHTGRD